MSLGKKYNKMTISNQSVSKFSLDNTILESHKVTSQKTVEKKCMNLLIIKQREQQKISLS